MRCDVAAVKEPVDVGVSCPHHLAPVVAPWCACTRSRVGAPHPHEGAAGGHVVACVGEPFGRRRCPTAVDGDARATRRPVTSLRDERVGMATVHAGLVVLLLMAGASPAWMIGSVRLVPLLFAVVVTTFVMVVYHRTARQALLARHRGTLPVVVSASVFIATGLTAETARFAALVDASAWVMQLLAVLAVLGLPASAAYRLLRPLAMLAAAWGGSVAIATILQAFDVLPGARQVNRSIELVELLLPVVFFGNPNPLAVFLATCLLLTFLPVVVGRRGRMPFLVSRIVLVAALLVTASRAAWLGVIVGSVLASLLTAPSRRLRRVGLGTAISGLVAAFVVSVSPPLVEALRRAMVGMGWPYGSALERLELMRVAQRMWLDRPWLGHGPGSYARMASEFGFEPASALGMPHNVILQSAAEMGVMGMLLLAVFLGVMLALPRHVPFAVIAAFWSATVALAFGWPLTHGLGEAYLALAALGWLLASTMPRGEPPGVAPPAMGGSLLSMRPGR